MDLTAIGYVLLIIPGFLLVWTFRHFTKSKEIGGFEYAAWSFVWGVAQLFFINFYIGVIGVKLPLIPINDELFFAAGALGIGMGSLAFSLLFGLIGAFFSNIGIFCWIDNFVSKILQKPQL